MTKELLKKELEASFRNIGSNMGQEEKSDIIRGVMGYYDYVEKSGVDSFTKTAYIVKIYIDQMQKKFKLTNKKVRSYVYGVVFKMGLNLLSDPVEYNNYPNEYFKNEENRIDYETPEFNKYLVSSEDTLSIWQNAFSKYLQENNEIRVRGLSGLYRDAYNFVINRKNYKYDDAQKVLQKVMVGDNNE